MKANLLKAWLMVLTCAAVTACGAWDSSAQMKDLETSEKEALCDYAYDAWGARPVTSLCDPPADQNLETDQFKLHLDQGERAEHAVVCVADATHIRWVDCPVETYVACLEAVDAAVDICVSLTADPCKEFATCVAANAPE